MRYPLRMCRKRAAVTQLLDNALKIEAEHGTDAAFPQGFAAFVRSHGLPRATAYRHRERVKLGGSRGPERLETDRTPLPSGCVRG